MNIERRSLLSLLVVASLACIAAGQCQDSTCGPNAKCASSTSRRCVCNPGYYGRPPFKQCRLESDPECVNDAGCPDNQACRDHLCLSPCGWTCSPDHRCIVQNHKAKCGPGIYPTAAPKPVSLHSYMQAEHRYISGSSKH